MAEFKKQDLSTSGQCVTLQTEAASEVLCGASSHTARANKVSYCFIGYSLCGHLSGLSICSMDDALLPTAFHIVSWRPL